MTKNETNFLAQWGMFLALTVVGLLFAFPLKWTWNYAITYVFSLPELTWGHAWCLYFVFGMLVKSIHMHVDND